MDRNVGVRKLIADLVGNEQIEVRRAEIISRDLTQWCETTGRAPSGTELEAWLGKQKQVLELYAGAKLLDELIERYLCTPLEKVYAEAEHPELEAHLHDGPDVPEPYLVYADWLQEQSDVRGELIALGVSATTGTFEARARFDSFLKEHDERLFGKLTRQLWGLVELTWKFGVIRSITEVADETPMTAALWEELLQLRVCRLVQSIAFNQPLGIGVEEAVAAAASPTVKHLKLHVRNRVPSLLTARPLRSLALTGASVTLRGLPETLDTLELAVTELDSVDDVVKLEVQELRLRVNSKTPEFAARLRLPRVERLRIELDDGEFHAGRTLELLGLPVVKHLTITNGQLDKDEILTLTRLPWTRQLASLALTDVELSDDSLQMLVDSHALPALRELDLSSNELTDAALLRAQGLAETVITGRQSRPGAAAEHRAIYQRVGYYGRAAGEIDEDGWQQVGRDGEILWAHYRGTNDYELYVSSTDGSRFGCTCPSRYQPCKHVAALTRLPQRREIAELPAQLTDLVVT